MLSLKRNIFTMCMILYLSTCILTQGKLTEDEIAENNRQKNEDNRIKAEALRVETEESRVAIHPKRIQEITKSSEKLSHKSNQYKQKLDSLEESTRATQTSISNVNRDLNELESQIKSYQENPTDEITQKAKSEQERIKKIQTEDQEDYDSFIAKDKLRIQELEDSRQTRETLFNKSLDKTKTDMTEVEGQFDTYKKTVDGQILVAEKASKDSNEAIENIQAKKVKLEADFKEIQAGSQKKMEENKQVLIKDIKEAAGVKIQDFQDSQTLKFNTQSEQLKTQLVTQESDLNKILSDTKDLAPKIEAQKVQSSEIINKEVEKQANEIKDIRKRFQISKETIQKQKEMIDSLQKTIDEQKKVIEEHQKHLNVQETPKDNKKEDKKENEKVSEQMVGSDIFGNLILTFIALSVFTLVISGAIIWKILFPAKKLLINERESNELNEDIEQVQPRLKLFDF